MHKRIANIDYNLFEDYLDEFTRRNHFCFGFNLSYNNFAFRYNNETKKIE